MALMIVIDEKSKSFRLRTENTAYIFHVEGNRFLYHDYYGPNSNFKADKFKLDGYTFSPYPPDYDESYALNDKLLEFSFFDSSDYRCSALKLRGGNGNCCTSFDYTGYEKISGRLPIPRIPASRGQQDCETLAVYLKDRLTECKLTLYYTVFPQFDIITRYFTLENAGEKAVKIEKAMCLQLDLPGHAYDLISLYGAHCNERNVQRTPLFYGMQSVMSRRGASSHQFNPFIALPESDCSEDSGMAYAFNLMYSGSFLNEIEVDQSGNTRVNVGLGEENFGFLLEQGEKFHSPESLMLCTTGGLGEMSRKLHRFIRAAILPKEENRPRPIVLNTWEACYFNIDQKLLLEFAREGVQCGMDMLVMDDGWFGARADDSAGLGDWFTNKEKFPDGLQAFAERVKETGMKFGIWIEPEMVNPDSNLYRIHPDWCLNCPGRVGSLSRKQLVLDLCNPEVRQYLKDSFSAAFSNVPIDYMKWDFNRHLSEVGSNYLPAKRQDEAAFRYMLGVYDLYEWFHKMYPHAMIENCSGGGGRYDLAMMALSTQIWTSDNTNPESRVRIQYGSLLGYPAATMSCHVSDPGTDPGETDRLWHKYRVALGGILGYELNILKMSDTVKHAIKQQTQFYKKIESLIRCGNLYRLFSPFETSEEISSYYYTGNSSINEQAGDRILLSFLQSKGSGKSKEYLLKVAVADETAEYYDEINKKKYEGCQLKKGISIKSSESDNFSKMWYLVKLY